VTVTKRLHALYMLDSKYTTMHALKKITESQLSVFYGTITENQKM